LSEYDQLNYEDDKKNRMLESISIFESILSDKSLESIPIFLIFNKIDLFEMKMKTKDLSETFPDYDELPSSSSLISSKKLSNSTNKVKQPKSDYSHAIEFIRNQFLEKNSRENVFVLYTVATNKETLNNTMTDFLTLLYSSHSSSAPISKNQKKKK
jgi:GTPase SAR1 family protein